MGSAFLLCPARLLGQVLPPKTGRHSTCSPVNESVSPLDAHWKKDFSWHSCTALKCRKIDAFFACRASSAAVGAEVSLQEPIAEHGLEHDPAQVEEALVDDARIGQSSAAPELGTQKRRSPSSRENKKITVDNADLVAGATFKGQVVSIQPFGAFVDIGGFTQGLVHISRLSKSFVKNVGDVVQVGQEVNVQIVEVDLQAGRIALSLKGEEGEKEAERSSRPAKDAQQGRAPRRRDASSKPTTKLKKGETITGVVKNIIRSGVFATLPDGIDAFLPLSEANLRGANASLETQFQLGQELTARVLRVERGRVALTLKQEVDLAKINESLNKGSPAGATNPFVIAFRQNELISSYLAERQKLQDAAEGKVIETEYEAAAKAEVEDKPLTMLPQDEETEVPSDVETVDTASGAVLEESMEEMVQGDANSRDETKEVIGETRGESSGLIGEEPAVKGLDSPVESVEEAAGLQEAALEKVFATVQEVKVAPDVEVSAEKEAAMVATVEETKALANEATGKEVTVEDIAVVDEASFEEVLGPAVQGEVAPDEEVSAGEEAAIDRVVAAVGEALAPAKEEIGEEAAVEESHTSVDSDEVAAVGKHAPVEKALATVEEVVAPLEEASTGEEAAVEETLAAVEEVVAPYKGESTGASVGEVLAPAEDVSVAGEALVDPVLKELVTPSEGGKVTGGAADEELVAAVEGVSVAAEEAATKGVVVAAVAAVEEEHTEQELPVMKVVAAVEETIAPVEEVLVVAVEEAVAALEKGLAEQGVPLKEPRGVVKEAVIDAVESVAAVEAAVTVIKE